MTDEDPLSNIQKATRDELLRLAFCGGFSARTGDQPIQISSKKARALIALLALSQPSEMDREKIRGYLWSESPEKRAQDSLRNVIWSLKRMFDEVGFTGFNVTRDLVSLDPSRISIDLRQIDESLTSTSPDARLRSDADIFDQLLWGLEGIDPSYDDWLYALRETKKQETIRKLEWTIQNVDQPAPALIDIADVLRRFDPYSEIAYRALIQGHYENGASNSALTEYRKLWDVLEEGFDEEPSEQTQELIVKIKSKPRYDAPAKAAPRPEGLPNRPRIAGGEKSSIAVLPFHDLSPQTSKDCFAEGVTEDIINALSKFRWFQVSARNSTFQYSSSSADPTEIGARLGVDYVLLGSVRRSDKRTRLSVQLVETASGVSIWSDRFDRLFSDIFDLQDEITETVVAALEPEIAEFERERASSRATNDLRAWDFFHRGVHEIWKMSREGIAEGGDYLRRATASDPNFAQPYSYLAFQTFLRFLFGSTEDNTAMFEEGMSYANVALSIDRREYFARFAKGRLFTMVGQHQDAIHELTQSINTNPSFAFGQFGLGATYVFAGDGENALPPIERAMRLSPNDPLMWIFQTYRGGALMLMDRVDEAIICLEAATSFHNAQYWAFAELASLYVERGQIDQAQKAFERARLVEPSLSADMLMGPIRGTGYIGGERIIENLRKIGLT